MSKKSSPKLYPHLEQDERKGWLFLLHFMAILFRWTCRAEPSPLLTGKTFEPTRSSVLLFILYKGIAHSLPYLTKAVILCRQPAKSDNSSALMTLSLPALHRRNPIIYLASVLHVLTHIYKLEQPSENSLFL